MNGVLARVSKFGFQIDGDKTLGDDGKQKWYNLSKYEKDVTLQGFSKGDAVDYEVNKKGFATKLLKLSAAPASNPVAGDGNTVVPYADAVAGPITSPVSDNLTYKDLRITRLSAISTAFGVLTHLQAEGDSQDDLFDKAEVLTKRLTRFALTGDFDEPNVEEKN